MKKIEISAEKGFFKSFLKVFIDHEISKRVKMTIQIHRVTHEQYITFIPKTGEKIEMDDFKTLTKLIIENEI